MPKCPKKPGGVAMSRLLSQARGSQARSVSQTVVRTTPLWEVDLGAVQRIAQIRLHPEADTTISNYWVMVSAAPFASDNLKDALKTPEIWCRHIKELSKPNEAIDFEAETKGRYVRIQSVENTTTLALDEIEVFLPEQVVEMPDKMPPEKLRIRNLGVTPVAVTRRIPKRIGAIARSGFFQDVRTSYGQTYLLSFELCIDPENAKDRRLFIWWNGQLLSPKNFDIGGSEEKLRIEVEVTGSGGLDRLMFREDAVHGVGLLPEKVSLKAKSLNPAVKGQAPELIDVRRFQPMSLADRTGPKTHLGPQTAQKRISPQTTHKLATSKHALTKGQDPSVLPKRAIGLGRIAGTPVNTKLGTNNIAPQNAERDRQMAWLMSYLGLGPDGQNDEIIFK